VVWLDCLLSLQWRSFIDSACDCANTRYPNEQGRVSFSALSKVQAAQARNRVDLHCYVAHGPDTVAAGKAA
jgi:hypothetical protein